MIPLTQEQFRDALRKGKGRALLHVHEFGGSGLEEDVLRACEQSLVYDAQSEGTRSEWLYDIVTAAGLVEAVKPRVLAALEQPATMEQFWDVAQLYCLAAIFARNGHDDARDAVYRKFDRKEFIEAWLGGIPLITADGLAGFLHVADVTGDRLANEPGYWDGGDCEYLFHEACERLGEEAVTNALAEAAEKNANCRTFRDAIQKHQDDVRKYNEEQEEKKLQGRPLRERKCVEEVLQIVESSGPEAVGFLFWLRGASALEIQTVFERMLAEHRPMQLQRFLQMFRLCDMPRVDGRILQLARTGPAELRGPCFDALGRIQDERIHQLAHELLSQNPPMPEAISLFRNNYESRDHAVIELALPRQGDDDVLHGIVLDLVKISDTAGSEFLYCLQWVYESSPCSCCRESAVRRMVDLQIAPQAILHECLADSYEDTRKLATAALAGTDAKE